jgi:5'-nucleotidase
LVQQVSERGLEQDILLNVNIPNLSHDEIRGVRITTLGRRIYNDQLVKREDPRGRAYYWITGSDIRSEGGEDSDVVALDNNYVSITPIHLDMTNHNLLEKLRSWDLRF